ELDAVGLDLPGVVIRRTGGERDSLETHQARGRDRHVRRRAARAALMQVEMRGPEFGPAGRGVTAAVACDVQQRVVVVNMAVGLDRLILGVVLHLVGANFALALAHLHVAAQLRRAVHAERCRIARHVDVAAGAGCMRRRARGRDARRCAGWFLGPGDSVKTAEQGDDHPQWAQAQHEGRHYNGRHMHETDARVALIREWLAHELRLPLARLEPASSDGSFRRYFRAFAGATTYVVMDAPPGKEDVRPYLRVSEFLAGVGVHVPHVHEADAARGLLLLEDLGTTLYLERLQAGDDPARLYREALAALVNIQVRRAGATRQWPRYDEPALERELALMREWFLRRHLQLRPDAADEALLTGSFAF